jgi:hypothetical protein
VTGGRPRAKDPVGRKCLFCDKDLVRRREPNGRFETLRDWVKRKFCSRGCRDEYKTRPIEERFWEKVSIDDSNDGCWEWTKLSRDDFGYGLFLLVGHKNERAHRVAWRLTNGPIPSGMKILHSCDNPPCCRPGHLFIGTDLDNARDRDRKGRGVILKGDQCKQTKVPDAALSSIRERIQSGEKRSAVAAEYDVSYHTIWDITTRTRGAGSGRPKYHKKKKEISNGQLEQGDDHR